MKILLLGELSGVHQELAPGLRLIGHEVTVAHSKMANPDFASDIPFYRAPLGNSSAKVWIRDIVSQLSHAPKLTGYDIVQIITPKFFNWKIHGVMMRYLRRHNRKLVIINTACTSDFHRRVAQLTYRPCKECLRFDLKTDACIYDRPDERRAEHLAFELADAIVATHFEYAWALADTPFARKVVGIPLPVDTNRFRPAPLPGTEKIRIWYGETRYGAKGGPFIHAALDRLAASPMSTRVEIIRTARLAPGEYQQMLESASIVIDQASSYATGMNGLYGMAKGRVVLSGAEAEELEFWNRDEAENPVIAIRPDADQIHDALVDLVERKAELPELGRRSAAYVAKYHAADVIARQYEALYQRLLGG